ncbi:NADPH-dependent oxidoreductase [Mesorhizobium sp. DCY119]|nr:NADPH-dependent oxidoreductase [Mesorhizobium sp. DCY119]
MLQRRYGDASLERYSPANQVIEVLLRHRSARRFFPEPIGDDLIKVIVAAAQSASTGLNFQNWSVVLVRDEARKAKIATLAADQQFIRDAPVLLIWVADWARARAIAGWHNAPTDGADFFDSTISTIVDTALAAQNALTAAESLGYGACFVGAIRNNLEPIADELGLPPHTFPLVGLSIGRIDPTDKASIKPRLPQEAILHRERYAAPDPQLIETFEKRIGAYYESQGDPHSWIASVLRRVRGGPSMEGRERIRDILVERGLPSW